MLNNNYSLSYTICKVIILVLFFGISANAQYTTSSSASRSNADLSIKIYQNNGFADLDIEFGQNLLVEDFSVALTNSRYKADVIIDNNILSADFNVNINGLRPADLEINYSETSSVSDISIQFESGNYADYFIYTSNRSVSREEIIAALLPIINAHLDYELEGVPFWSENQESRL